MEQLNISDLSYFTVLRLCVADGWKAMKESQRAQNSKV